MIDASILGALCDLRVNHASVIGDGLIDVGYGESPTFNVCEEAMRFVGREGPRWYRAKEVIEEGLEKRGAGVKPNCCQDKLKGLNQRSGAEPPN